MTLIWKILLKYYNFPWKKACIFVATATRLKRSLMWGIDMGNGKYYDCTCNLFLFDVRLCPFGLFV